MGSGKYLNRAQEKYGIENFTKEILFVFDNADDMYKKEAEIVNEDFLVTENTYNLRIGGMGGFDYINANPDQYLTSKRLAALMPRSEQIRRWKEKWDTDAEFREKHRENARLGNKVALQKHPNGIFFGKRHSKHTIEKMKAAAVGRGEGEKNSQFGTMWITNGLDSKKIKITDTVPMGWRRGRKVSK